jgi:hypothetical protein
LTQSFAGVDKVVRVQLGRAFLDTIARLLPEDEHADALLIAMLPLRVAVSHGAGIHLIETKIRHWRQHQESPWHAQSRFTSTCRCLVDGMATEAIALGLHMLRTASCSISLVE